MQSIICRQDSTRNQVVFLLDTLNNDKQTLDVWKGDGKKIESTTVDFYRTTRSLSDQDETTLANKFVGQFDIKDGIILRRRLYKISPNFGQDNTAKEAHVPEPLDKQVFVEKLIVAFTTALREAASA
jgi:hypothetical protein